MTITIDAHTAFYALEETVRAVGREYVYTPEDGRCTYAKNGGPSCLVGQALARLGVPVVQLEAMDSQAFGSILYVELPEGLELVGDAREVFGKAQTAQDNGRRWGVALMHAGEVL